MDNLDSYLAAVVISKQYKSGIYMGCAKGHRIPILNSLLKLDGLDISSIYIKGCKERFPKNKFIVADIRKYKSKKKYEVGITHGLLIHIHPRDIKKTIKNIMGMAKQAIFVESSAKHVRYRKKYVKYDPKKYWDNRSKFSADTDGRNDLPMVYYYAHDYESLFDTLGYRYQVVMTFDRETNARMYLVWQK